MRCEILAGEMNKALVNPGLNGRLKLRILLVVRLSWVQCRLFQIHHASALAIVHNT